LGAAPGPGFILRSAAGSTASLGTGPGAEPRRAPPCRVDPPTADGRMTSVINGTTLGHVASGGIGGIGGIGGPAKKLTGINGTFSGRSVARPR